MVSEVAAATCAIAVTLAGTVAMVTSAGADQGDAQFEDGTFHLQAVDLGTSVYDHPPPGVTSKAWHPDLTAGAASVETDQGTSVITVRLTNADPTATYVARFKVYDSGTQAGLLTAVSYTPTTKANALMDHAVVKVQQHGKTTPRDASFRGLWFQPGSGSSSFRGFRGCDGEQLNFFAVSSTSLRDMLSPNTSSLRAGSRGWVAFMVVVSFSKHTPNVAEGESLGFKITITGHGSAPEHDGGGGNGSGSDKGIGGDSDGNLRAAFTPATSARLMRRVIRFRQYT